MLEPSTRPRRNPSTASEMLTEELLVLDLESGSYYGLNPVAAMVWDRLDGATSIHRIADEIAAHFSIAGDRALQDVQDLLAELHERGLVSWN